MVTCCLVSNSLLCCTLSEHHNMHAFIKQLLIHWPLPLNYTPEMFHILCNQHHFLCLLIVRVPPLGVACVNLVLLACHGRGVWLTLCHALCGCMAMRPGWTRLLLNLVGLEQYTRDIKTHLTPPCVKYMTKPAVMIVRLYLNWFNLTDWENLTDWLKRVQPSS